MKQSKAEVIATTCLQHQCWRSDYKNLYAGTV